MANRLLKILAKALLWSLIAVVTLEACARLDDWTSYGASPLGIYDNTVLNAYDQIGQRGRPNARYLKWKLNSLGFRGPELDPHAVHILCVGSSETFGQYESEGHEWPRQVERLLNQRLAGNPQVQLVNTGFAGETFPTSVLRLPERLAEVQPKFVLLYPSVAHYLSVPYIKPGPPPVAARFRFRMQARVESVLKKALPEPLQTALRQRDIAREAPAYGPQLDNMPIAMQDRFRADLEQAVKLIRQAGAEPILITHANRFKDRVSLEERYMLISWRRFYPMLREQGFIPMERTMNGVIRDVASSSSAPLIDAAAAMPAGPAYFADFVHFTDQGSLIFSQLVANRVAGIIHSESGASTPPLAIH